MLALRWTEISLYSTTNTSDIAVEWEITVYATACGACVCAQYLAVSEYSDNRDSQWFNMLFESRSHGCSQLLQDSQCLLDLETTTIMVILTLTFSEHCYF